MSPLLRRLVSLLLLSLTACQKPADDDPKQGTLTSAPDSVATMREISASITGDAPPGRQSYAYRSLYAGMVREKLERAAPAMSPSPGDSTRCQPSPKAPVELLCTYDVTLAPDSAAARIEITYAAELSHGIRSAREITVTRQLPLDVDGVRLAAALADAFERQTALLDSRDASYGHHQAHVRMGTLNATRPNFAEVTVSPRLGRDVLVVKLSHGVAPPRPPVVKAAPSLTSPAPPSTH